jgi:DNA invertase Pin-like site-specific DNA recombinase
LNYIAGDGDRLPDLVATISELRHCPTFARRAWSSSSNVHPIEVRPGFAALIDRIEGNGVRTVVVEDASRFARDLVAKNLGCSC